MKIPIIELIKKYIQTNNEQNLPKFHKTNRNDIFNGNLYDAGGFIFTYILIFVVLIVFLSVLVYFAYFSPSTPNNTIEHSAKFISCDIKKDEVVLISTDNQIYKIHFSDEQIATDKIQALCNGNTLVTTYSKKITSDNGNDYYSICAIIYNNDYILSFEQTNQLERQKGTPVVILAVIMCFVWSAFGIFSIIIGRNPKKFSKRVVRMFFKDGYIKY